MQLRISSRSVSAVVLQHPTESLSIFDLADNSTLISHDEFVVQSLLNTLALVTLDSRCRSRMKLICEMMHAGFQAAGTGLCRQVG